MRTLLLLLALFCAGKSDAQTDSLFVTTSDSVRLFVKRSGSGTPVLFIHGGPGSNSAYFEYSGGRVFEKDAQMIYLDQRGCGRSDNAKDKNYSLDRMIRDFEEVRTALGLKQWTLMPHSFGGILATAYADRHPGTVQAMVLLNCTINLKASATAGIQRSLELLPGLAPHKRAYLTDDSKNLYERWFHSFSLLDSVGSRYQLFFDSREADSLHSAVTQVFARHWDFQQYVWSHPEYFEDYFPVSARIKVPVLAVGGTRDYTIGVTHPEFMRFPNMKKAYIGGGHALYMEHGAELYAAVAPFLRARP